MARSTVSAGESSASRKEANRDKSLFLSTALAAGMLFAGSSSRLRLHRQRRLSTKAPRKARS